MSSTPKRRWYQFGFSIRDLLLLTVIVALAMGWWVDRCALSARVERLERVKRIQALPILDSYSRLPTSLAPVPNPPKEVQPAELAVSGYAEIPRVALQRGDSLDASLAVLRQQGATIIESIKAVRDVNSVRLGEAKRLVANSPAWEDHREPHRLPVDEILAAIEDLPNSSAPAPSPSKP